MKLRTEIETIRGSFTINHDDKIVMLGSCFTDNIGQQLAIDGFDVVSNPMGPLYNPLSLAKIIERGGSPYTIEDLLELNGTWHCLDYASRYSSSDSEDLLASINEDYLALYSAIQNASVVIITFGSARVYEHTHSGLVGNCHKIPSFYFTTRSLSVDEIVKHWQLLLPNKHIIFTISPIRYLADGMVNNSLSKATLRLAIEQLRRGGVDYFPAFEIMNDDLRDYRFYARDMKHPSDVAIDYIYKIFEDAYFDKSTMVKAEQARKEYLRSQHRPIIEQK